jgi:hypothetical protein
MTTTCDEPPFDPPPPRAMAEALMSRAWDDDCPDLERVLLEQAARSITGLLVRLAAVSERDEARRATRSE